LKQFPATIISNTELMPGYHLVCLKAPYIATEGKPGQFITVSCGRDTILRRPFSIHRVDSPQQSSILFAKVGSGTRWLSERRKGENLDLLGPLGNGFSISEGSKKVLLAAGGIGIAPLAFMAQKALNNGKIVKLLIGARTKDCLYPLKLLPDGVETFVTTEDGSLGERGKLTDILPKYVDWADQVYACGPLAMYQSMVNQSKQWQRKKPIQVSLEVTIGCGMGACFGCSIKTREGMKRVCLDGPVFNLDEVILEEVRI
jgi:dihydroorotate dehydrogenase electron transfer subunit